MRILLVDGTNIVMRYAHAMMPDIVALGGKAPVSDVDNVMAAVERAIREVAKLANCTHAIVALDSGVESRRKQLYPDYKGKRIDATLPWSNRLAIWLHGHGMMTLRWPGEEADDVIATLVARINRAEKTCAILSGDGDMLQLASPFCEVYQFGRGDEPKYVLREMSWITAKYGLQHAGQLVLYKALVGDTSDNLPGVKGVGKVKAQTLLRMFQTADALRASAMVPPEQFNLMLQLVTLNDAVPLDPIVPAQCRIPVTIPRD